MKGCGPSGVTPGLATQGQLPRLSEASLNPTAYVQICLRGLSNVIDSPSTYGPLILLMGSQILLLKISDNLLLYHRSCDNWAWFH